MAASIISYENSKMGQMQVMQLREVLKRAGWQQGDVLIETEMNTRSLLEWVWVGTKNTSVHSWKFEHYISWKIRRTEEVREQVTAFSCMEHVCKVEGKMLLCGSVTVERGAQSLK